MEQLRKILTVEQLPAMPHSALTVLQLDSNLSKVNIDNLVRPIEADPGLAAQVLKFLNSSYFGFQSSISNVKQGIALVGIRIVKNFVLWKAVFSLIPKSRGGNFDVNALWQDSLRRAMFSRFALLDLKKGDPEMAFAGALLQDMALPLLLKQRPQEYGAVLAMLAPPNDERLSTLEEATFGWNHADAASFLGRNWKLPDQLVVLLENHLRLDDCAAEAQTQPELFTVALSSLLPMAVREDWLEKERFMKNLQHLFPSATLKSVEAMFEKIDKGFEEYAMIIQIAKPKKTLVSYLEEKA